MKIAVAPTVIFLELLMFRKLPQPRVVASVLVVCVGIAVSTVSETQVRFLQFFPQQKPWNFTARDCAQRLLLGLFSDPAFLHVFLPPLYRYIGFKIFWAFCLSCMDL